MSKKSQAPKVHALIVAAGMGSRFGGAIPKQYLPLCVDNKSQCVLQHSVAALAQSVDITELTLVVAADDKKAPLLDFLLPVHIVTGGLKRWQSVANGVAAIAKTAHKDDLILIHDAARPALSAIHLQDVIDTAKNEPYGATLGIPISDTLKKINNDGMIKKTLSREQLWAVQTPQVFRVEALLQALKFIQKADKKGENITDECMGFELMGLPIKMVLGAKTNLKITYADDLILVQMILQQMANVKNN